MTKGEVLRQIKDHEIEIILSSNLFDEAFYTSIAKIDLAGRKAVHHYLEHGEAAGIFPSAEFDPALYAATNPDVVESGDSLLIHYITFGQREGRYGSRDALRRDATVVSEAMGSKIGFVGSVAAFDKSGLDPLEAHLAYKWRDGARAVVDFDDRHYHAVYRDVGDSGQPPLVHFIETGRAEGRMGSREAIEEAVSAIKGSFDEAFYLNQGDIHPYLDPIHDYVTTGWRTGRSPHPDFSPAYYLRRYPDIQRLGVEPFGHFVRYGKHEGRVGRPRVVELLRRGQKMIDPAKPTIMVALHECSRTGAPLLGLDLGREISETCNVIFATPKEGPIYPDLLEVSCYVAVGVYDYDHRLLFEELVTGLGLKGLIANSIETVNLMIHASRAGVPVVGLIHEFAEYTLPHSKVLAAVEAADIVVTPSHLVRDSIRKAMRRLAQMETGNLRIRSQGKLESLGKGASKEARLTTEKVRQLIDAPVDQGLKIILGAGFVQSRKGVDLFIQTAAELRKLHGDAFRFVWVGEGYDPDWNVESVWLKTAIEKLGLEKMVKFVPHQPSLDPFIEIADIFYLPSRLDPFPNVVIDALTAGRRVVCFEGASGVAEWIEDGRLEGASVRYMDVAAAAQAMRKFFGKASGSEKNRKAAAKHFNMSDYASDLIRLIDEATAARDTRLAGIKLIRESGAFDPVFHNGGAADPTGESLGTYAARASKGAIVWNPRPGFNDGLYRATHDLLGVEQIPLAHAIASGAPDPVTHRCVLLNETSVSRPDLKVAVHLHLHYADLAESFCKRLEQSFEACDVFITTTSEKGRKEVEYAFRNYGSGSAVVDIMDNAGRDIGPMIELLNRRRIADDYDLFGHFHGKKTVGAGEGLGDRWREFLLDTLLGDKNSTAHLLTLFARDPKLGLAFAEDRFGIGWTLNKPYAEDLALRMSPQPTVDIWPVFPVGTMFWARPAALRPLIDAGLTAADYPLEPLPDDGTLLHAVERLLPAITRAAGLEWCTVRRRGVNRLS
jgi:glycosyltransferase involved in cell wall biosynthesis